VLWQLYVSQEYIWFVDLGLYYIIIIINIYNTIQKCFTEVHAVRSTTRIERVSKHRLFIRDLLLRPRCTFPGELNKQQVNVVFCVNDPEKIANVLYCFTFQNITHYETSY